LCSWRALEESYKYVAPATPPRSPERLGRLPYITGQVKFIPSIDTLMPVREFKHKSDDEVGALHAYLWMVSPREYGNR